MPEPAATLNRETPRNDFANFMYCSKVRLFRVSLVELVAFVAAG
jgi:hypothetical protein